MSTIDEQGQNALPPNDPKLIMERIQKLLAVADETRNADPNTIRNATERIQALLTRYNLTLADIERHNPEQKHPYIEEDFKLRNAKAGDTNWRRALLSVLARHHFCHALWNSGELKWAQIVGQQHNIDIVTHLYVTLERQIEALREREETKRKASALFSMGLSKTHWLTWRKSFYLGIVQGLDKLLEQRKWASTDERALVKVKDAELDAAVEQMHPNLNSRNLFNTLLAEEAYIAGKAAASDLRLEEALRKEHDEAAALMAAEEVNRAS